MHTYFITTEFLYRSTTEIQAASSEEAKKIWEEMTLEQIVGKKNINIEELEDGVCIAIDENQ